MVEFSGIRYIFLRVENIFWEFKFIFISEFLNIMFNICIYIKIKFYDLRFKKKMIRKIWSIGILDDNYIDYRYIFLRFEDFCRN